MTARTCNYCSNPDCPYKDVPAEGKRSWLRKQVIAGMPCWQPFPENIGVVHDEEGRPIGSDMVFKNGNGSDYIIVAGNDDRALLREIDHGGYVIARDLDWVHMCWTGGSYYSADEFELAVETFLEKEI
jgi:hypothetical protein